jgi:cyanophycin synthetase
MSSLLTPDNLSISSRLILEELQKRHQQVEIIDEYTLLVKNPAFNWYVRGSRTSFQSSIGKTFADMKHISKTVMHYFDIPTALSSTINKVDDRIPSELTYPLVAKPSFGNQGTSVYVGLENEAELRVALEKIGPTQEFPVVVEEMLEGVEYRILCIDFKFVAAAFRKPAFVTGDGTHTIEELIKLKNQHPWRGAGHVTPLSFIKVDEMVVALLTKQNLKPSSIPPKDKEIHLRKTANLSTGGEAWNVSDQVCPENKALFERIARVCDLNTIGIDVMCQSLSTPLVEQSKAGIIEINVSPGLRMHHYPLQGEPINVAAKIIDMAEQRIQTLTSYLSS